MADFDKEERIQAVKEAVEDFFEREGAKYQEIPAYIKDHEELVEGDQVVQRAVDRRAGLGGDQVFRDKIQGEICDPAEQQQRVAKTRLGDAFEAEAGIVIQLVFHSNRPREGYFSGSHACGCSDRG